MGVVLIDRRDDGIARVVINRPNKRNALNDEVRHALIAELPVLLRDETVHALRVAISVRVAILLAWMVWIPGERVFG